MAYINGKWMSNEDFCAGERTREPPPPRTFQQILADQEEDAFIRRTLPNWQRPAVCRDGCVTPHTRQDHYRLSFAEQPWLEKAALEKIDKRRARG